jgi:plasmid maintenance system antidote protein VapI
MKTNKLSPIHPGEILREEFMKPRALSQNLLNTMSVTPNAKRSEIHMEIMEIDVY